MIKYISKVYTILDNSAMKKWGQNEGSSWMWFGKELQFINAGEGVEKREPSYTVGGNAN